MINMDTEKDYGEAHLNPLQRQNMRIFIGKLQVEFEQL